MVLLEFCQLYASLQPGSPSGLRATPPRGHPAPEAPTVPGTPTHWFCSFQTPRGALFVRRASGPSVWGVPRSAPSIVGTCDRPRVLLWVDVWALLGFRLLVQGSRVDVGRSGRGRRGPCYEKRASLVPAWPFGGSAAGRLRERGRPTSLPASGAAGGPPPAGLRQPRAIPSRVLTGSLLPLKCLLRTYR